MSKELKEAEGASPVENLGQSTVGRENSKCARALR